MRIPSEVGLMGVERDQYIAMASPHPIDPVSSDEARDGSKSGLERPVGRELGEDSRGRGGRGKLGGRFKPAPKLVSRS